MANDLEFRFTAADNTALDAYGNDVTGGPWRIISGNHLFSAIFGNEAYGGGGAVTVWGTTGTISQNDFVATWDVDIQSLAADGFAMLFRSNSTVTTWYGLRYFNGALLMFDEAFTAQGSFPAFTSATGITHITLTVATVNSTSSTATVRVQRASDNFYLASSGTWQAGATDVAVITLTYTAGTAHANGRYMGIRWEGSGGTTTGYHLDNLIANGSAASSFTVSPGTIPANHNGNITLVLTGTGTNWVAQTFTVSGVAGIAKVSQTINSTTSVTLVISLPAALPATAGNTGTLVVSDGTITANVSVGAPTISATPNSGTTGGILSTTFTGVNTIWSTSHDNPTLTISGGTGASIAATTNTSDTSSSATVTYGSAGGTLTVTDPSTGAQCTITVTAGPVTIAVNDANIVYPVGKYLNGSTYVEIPAIGNRTYLGFTKTSIKINLDNSILSGLTNPYKVGYSLDGAVMQYVTIGSGTTNINITGLSNANHTIMFYPYDMDFTLNRWNNATPLNTMRITSYLLDAGAVTIPSASWVYFKKKTFTGYLFSDSTGETEYSRDSGNTDGYNSWVHALGEAFDCEFSLACYAANGYLLNGTGNYPKLASCITSIRNTIARDFTGCKYVFINSGRNDYLQTQTPAGTAGTVAAEVKASLAALRGANGTMIILILPPMGQGSIIPSSGVLAGFAAYQAATPDANCYLLNPGDGRFPGAGGANGSAQGIDSAVDQVHTIARANGVYAAVVTRLTYAALNPGGALTIKRSSVRRSRV